MSDAEEPFALDRTFVVFDPQLNADTVTVTETLYADLDERYSKFKGHTLVSSHCFESDWSTWEVHPCGDELVCLVSGDVELVLRVNGRDEAVRLNTPGSFVIVPRNTWHTARVHAPATMIFMTPGEGTENRESPPA